MLIFIIGIMISDGWKYCKGSNSSFHINLHPDSLLKNVRKKYFALLSTIFASRHSTGCSEHVQLQQKFSHPFSHKHPICSLILTINFPLCAERL